MKFNELVANAAIYSTALDITDAANALAAEGHPVDPNDLATTENDVADIQGLLDQMLTGGRIALVTENFELDVTDVQLHSSPAGRRHRQR